MFRRLGVLATALCAICRHQGRSLKATLLGGNIKGGFGRIDLLGELGTKGQGRSGAIAPSPSRTRFHQRRGHEVKFPQCSPIPDNGAVPDGVI